MVGAVLCSFVVVVAWLLCCGRVSLVVDFALEHLAVVKV